MKKVMFLAVVAALSTGYVNAQEVKAAPAPQSVGRIQKQMDPAKFAQMRADRLQKDIPDLSADQKKQVYEIYLKSAQDRPEFKADPTARQKMADMRKAEDDQIGKVLTADQSKKYADMQAQREVNRKAVMEQRMKARTNAVAPAPAPASK